MMNKRNNITVILIGLAGILLYCVISIINHNDEVKAVNLMTRAIESSQSSTGVELALEILGEVKSLGFCYAECKLLYGQLYNRKGEYDRGFEYCSEANMKENNQDALFCLACSHVGLGNNTRGLEYLTQTLQMSQAVMKYKEDYIQRFAHVYLNHPNNITTFVHSDVVNYYSAYIGISETVARGKISYSYLRSLIVRNDTNRALVYSKAIANNTSGNDQQEIYSHFSVWMELGRYEEAIQFVNYVHFLYPKKSPLKIFTLKMNGRALIALDTEQHIVRAIEVLSEAHYMDGNDVEAMSLLAIALEKNNDIEQSIAILRKLISSSSNEFVPLPDLVRLSKLLLSTSQYVDAFDTLEKALRWCDGSDTILTASPSECSEVHLIKGKVLYRMGDTSSAIQSYYRACKGKSIHEKEALQDLMDIANNIVPSRGVKSVRSPEPVNETRPVVEASPVEKILKTAPKAKASSLSAEELAAKALVSAQQYLQMARAHYGKGSLDKALSEISKAIRKSPEYIEIYALRADLYADLEKFDEAIKDYIKVYSYFKSNNDSSENYNKSVIKLVDLALHLDRYLMHSRTFGIFDLLLKDDKFVGDVEVWFASARSFTYHKEYKLALSSLDRIQTIVDNTKDFDGDTAIKLKLVEMYSECYDKLGMKKESESVWKESIANNITSLLLMGDRQFDDKNYEDAVKSYTQHLESLQSSTDRSELGTVHQKLGKVYSELSKQSSAGSLSVKISDGRTVSSKYTELANTHYMQAMEYGHYDVETRRFFGANPLSTLQVSVPPKNEGLIGKLTKRKKAASEDGSTELFAEGIAKPTVNSRWVTRRMAVTDTLEQDEANDSVNSGGESFSPPKSSVGSTSRLGRNEKSSPEEALTEKTAFEEELARQERK